MQEIILKRIGGITFLLHEPTHGHVNVKRLLLISTRVDAEIIPDSFTSITEPGICNKSTVFCAMLAACVDVNYMDGNAYTQTCRDSGGLNPITPVLNYS